MNMYYYNGTYNNVCTQVRTTVCGRGRGLRGPVGVGWRACDMTHIMNQVHTHLVGLERASRSLNFLHLLPYYDL